MGIRLNEVNQKPQQPTAEETIWKNIGCWPIFLREIFRQLNPYVFENQTHPLGMLACWAVSKSNFVYRKEADRIERASG
jgi:hypothetical protein